MVCNNIPDIPVGTECHDIISPQPTNFSGDLAVDANGDIFVADYGVLLNNSNGTTIWKVTSEGEYSVFATGFSGASGNTFGPNGDLFQSNIAASRLIASPGWGGVRLLLRAGYQTR